MTVEGGDEDRVRLHSFQHLRDTGQVWVWAAGLGPLAGDSCEEEPVGPTSTKDACRKLTNVTESQKPGGPRDARDWSPCREHHRLSDPSRSSSTVLACGW